MPGAPLSRSASPRHVFELTGGSLCLDFVNTLEDRPRGIEEHVSSYEDVLEWARQTQAIGKADLGELAHRAGAEPRRASAVLRRALALRERLYRIFSALAAGESPPEDDLEGLNDDMARTLGRLRIVPEGGGFRWGWRRAKASLDAVLWPVIRAAGELLASEERSLVRECASESCSWLFLDRSRTRRRRWCDMKTCGNRAKARAYYRRRKQRDDGRRR